MNTWTKRILTVSAAAAGIGLVLMGVGMGMGGRPGVVFSKNGISSSYQKAAPYLQEKTAIDTFSGINLDIRSEASIQILPSGDNKYYVEYLLDGEAAEPICKVKDDTLTLSQAYSDANVIGVFGIALDDSDSVNPYISIYVPKDVKLKAIDIYNDYGNVAIEDRSMEHAEIQADYGDVSLNNVSAGDLNCTLSDGDFSADTFKTTSLTFVSTYGSAVFQNSDLGDAELQMEYGDLQCNTVKADQLNIASMDGNIELKETASKNADFTLEYGDLTFDAVSLESLDCTSEYGSVSLFLPASIQTYQVEIKLDYGALELPKDALLDHYAEEDGEVSYHADASDKKAENRISLQSMDGSVTIQYR